MSQVHDRLKEIPSPTQGSPPGPGLKLVGRRPSEPKPPTTKRQKAFLYVICGLCVLATAGLLLRKQLLAAVSPPPPVEVPPTLAQSIEALTIANKWPEALPLLEKAQEKNPNDANVLVLLALAKKKAADKDAAKSLLEKALKINPENEVAQNNYALILASQGAYDQAQKAYEKALSIRPIYPEAQMNLAVTSEATENWKLAILSYENFLKQDKTHTDLHKKISVRIRRLHSFSVNSVKKPSQNGDKL